MHFLCVCICLSYWLYKCCLHCRKCGKELHLHTWTGFQKDSTIFWCHWKLLMVQFFIGVFLYLYVMH
jgi:energy-converting hydrogenase Eha subunit G